MDPRHLVRSAWMPLDTRGKLQVSSLLSSGVENGGQSIIPIKAVGTYERRFSRSAAERGLYRTYCRHF